MKYLPLSHPAIQQLLEHAISGAGAGGPETLVPEEHVLASQIDLLTRQVERLRTERHDKAERYA